MTYDVCCELTTVAGVGAREDRERWPGQAALVRQAHFQNRKHFFFQVSQALMLQVILFPEDEQSQGSGGPQDSASGKGACWSLMS